MLALKAARLVSYGVQDTLCVPGLATDSWACFVIMWKSGTSV